MAEVEKKNQAEIDHVSDTAASRTVSGGDQTLEEINAMNQVSLLSCNIRFVDRH